MKVFLVSLIEFIDSISPAVTALATIALAYLTYHLAKATKGMVNSANVVASIDNNQWSIILADLVVQNSGSAPAFDVKVSFDPPLPSSFESPENIQPLSFISVLRPGQIITSSVCKNEDIGDKYRVTITWKHAPKSKKEASISYDIDLKRRGPISQWGESTPLVSLAKNVEKIRDDWKPFLQTTTRRFNVNVYSQTDRDTERQAAIKQRDEHIQAREQLRKAASQGDSE